MSGETTFGLIVMSGFASAIGGMLGMASGIFLVPILMTAAHLPIHAAVALSLVSVIVCSCASAPAYLRAGLTNVRLAAVLEVATTTGSLCGALSSALFSARILTFLFVAILFLSAWQMVRPRRPQVDAEERGAPFVRRFDGGYRDDSGRQMTYRVHRLPLGMILMFGAGMLSALLGIGSGVLKIPAMDSALRLPIKVSSATSNFMIGVTAAAAAIAYGITGAIDVARAAPICVGSAVGSVAGAHALRALNSDRLRMLFAVVLVGLAAQMLFAMGGASVGAGG